MWDCHHVRRLAEITWRGDPDQPENSHENHKREKYVHRRSGNGNQTALPPRPRKELVSCSGALLDRVVARHADVTAERQPADAVIRVAALYSPEARAESDGKHVHAHAAPFRDDEVAPLVEQDEDAEYDAAGD